MIFAVTDLALNHDRLQHIVLREHIFDVRIYLCNCVYILHTDTVHLCKFGQNAIDESGRCILSEFLGKLHRLIDCNACRYGIIIMNLIDRQS